MPLQVEFMSASRSPYSKPKNTLPPPKGDPWLFWWTIAIFLLLALTTLSWLGSLYIFRHPEKPRNYALLEKFQKLPPLKKFNERTVPQGKFHLAKEAYARYFGYSDEELATFNDLCKRNYIQNYAEEAPAYVRGEYRIYKVETLDPSRPFTSGFVVRAKSVDLPNVSIEFIFPTEAVPPEKPLRYGDDIVLDTNNTFASILHLSRLPEDSLCLTVVPLTYRSFGFDSQNRLVLSPPDRLNMKAAWPLTDDTPHAEKDVEVAGGAREHVEANN